MMLVAGAMACGLAACSDDDTTPSGNITPADQLYLPRNNATIMLETGNTTHFEWAVSKASKNGYITYELLFDKVDGDFSQPLYVLTSDNNGYEPSAKVASSTLNTVATLAGADLGETATVKWTVRAWCGLNSEIYGSEAGVRTVSLTRINSVDPMPSEIKISGGITEEQKELTLFAASVIHTAKGKVHGSARGRGLRNLYETDCRRTGYHRRPQPPFQTGREEQTGTRQGQRSDDCRNCRTRRHLLALRELLQHDL